MIEEKHVAGKKGRRAGATCSVEHLPFKSFLYYVLKLKWRQLLCLNDTP
jgi:hypothetical protein